MSEFAAKWAQLIQDNYPIYRISDLRDQQALMLNLVGEHPMITSANGFSHYFDLLPTLKNFQQPCDILNFLKILADGTNVNVNPTWDGLDELTGGLRKDFWNARSQGMNGIGGWDDDLKRAFSDFTALGIAFLKVGTIEVEGGDAVTADYLSPLNTFTDPFAPSPQKSQWITSSVLMSRQDAVLKFGDKVNWDAATVNFIEGVTTNQTDAVRVIEWWHTGVGLSDDEPTYMAWAGEFDELIVEEKSQVDGYLPIVVFTHYQPSGFNYPIGLIPLMQYPASIIDRETKAIVKRTQQDDALIVTAPELLDAEVWERIQAAEHNEELMPRFIMGKAGMENMIKELGPQNMFIRLPKQENDPDRQVLLNKAERNLEMVSSVGSLGAGVEMDRAATATEINALQSRSQAQISSSARAFTRGLIPFANLVGMIAEKFDTAPWDGVVAKVGMTFNKDDKSLTSKNVWAGAMIAKISPEELTVSDTESANQAKMQKFLTIYQLAQAPSATPELLRLLFETSGLNPDKYMPVAQTASPDSATQTL